MLNIIKEWYSKDKKIIAAALICGLIFSGLVASKGFSEEIQNGISKEVIRFHVRANSDSAEDQKVKMIVKNKVLEQFHDGLNRAENINETRAFLTENLEAIRIYANSIIKEEGYDYIVTARLCRDYFPTKVYGDVVFPAGEYEALRIDIGQATGQNWWCVMFPPLCFVDATQKEIPEQQKIQLKHILTEDEYELVTKAEKDSEVSVQVKFKIVELWQEFKHPIDEYAAQ